VFDLLEGLVELIESCGECLSEQHNEEVGEVPGESGHPADHLHPHSQPQIVRQGGENKGVRAQRIFFQPLDESVRLGVDGNAQRVFHCNQK